MFVCLFGTSDGPQGDYFTSSGSAHAYQVNNHSGNSERNRRDQNDFSSGNVHLPSEAEMMIETTSLAKEAAELLWETIAFQAGESFSFSFSCSSQPQPQPHSRQSERVFVSYVCERERETERERDRETGFVKMNSHSIPFKWKFTSPLFLTDDFFSLSFSLSSLLVLHLSVKDAPTPRRTLKWWSRWRTWRTRQLRLPAS